MKSNEENKDLNPNEIDTTADSNNSQNESNDTIRQNIKAGYEAHMVAGYESAKAELLAMFDRGELKQKDLDANLEMLDGAHNLFSGLGARAAKLTSDYNKLSPAVQNVILPAAVDSVNIAEAMSTECTHIANDTAEAVRINNLQTLANDTNIPTVDLMNAIFNSNTADDLIKLYNQRNLVGVAPEEGRNDAIAELGVVIDEQNTHRGDAGESTLGDVVPAESEGHNNWF